MKEFQSLGIDFISYQENIDTITPTGELIFHVMASLVQFESLLISQRVRVGMARAEAQGKRVSRAPLPTNKQKEIFEYLRYKRAVNEQDFQAISNSLRNCIQLCEQTKGI